MKNTIQKCAHCGAKVRQVQDGRPKFCSVTCRKEFKLPPVRVVKPGDPRSVYKAADPQPRPVDEVRRTTAVLQQWILETKANQMTREQALGFWRES